EVGNGPLVIEQITTIGTNAGEFTVGAQTCQVLHQNANCLVSVTFSPTAEGNRSAQLRVQTRGNRIFTVDLTGTGVIRPIPRGPEFSAVPTTIDFGQKLLLSNGPESTVTITNQGDQPLRITSVTPVGPGSPGDYTVSRNTCFGINVAPGASCVVGVKF